jgi:hypothetical protein
MIIIDESINDAMRERVLADDLKADVETMIRRLCLCCKREFTDISSSQST